METDVWNQQGAQGYDASSAHMYEPEVLGPTVDFLAQRAGRGPALEFAIGTGCVALPLRARGVPVAGIELSESMAAELRKKPGSGDIPVSIGDMARTRAPGEFSLVYLVYNAITCLLTQDQQVECFRNAARHLLPGGCFVIEVFVPDLQRLPPGEAARPFHVGEHHLGFDTFDLVHQRLVSHHYWIEGEAVRTFQSPHRFVWPPRARPDGQARGPGLARAVGGLEPDTLHRRQHLPRLGVAEAARPGLSRRAQSSEWITRQAATTDGPTLDIQRNL